MLRRAAFIAALGLLAACEADGDEVVCPHWAYATQACDPAVVAAIETWAGNAWMVGLESGAMALDGTISGLGAREVRILAADGSGNAVFHWPGELPEGLVPGEPVTVAHVGRWTVLSTSTRRLALTASEGFRGDRDTLPGDGPMLSYEEGCAVGDGWAVAIHVDGQGTLLPGDEASSGAWTIENLYGLGQTYDAFGRNRDCMASQAMQLPTDFVLLATAVWRAEEEVSCDPGIVSSVDELLEAPIAWYGIAIAGGSLPLEPTLATIERIEEGMIDLDLDGRQHAYFGWPGPLPEGLAVGDRVELATDNLWHELRGAIRLAIRTEIDFTYGGSIEPALGRIPLALAPLCGYPDDGGGMDCGVTASGTVEVFGLELPDGSVLLPGEEGQVGEATIGHMGAVQLPAYGTDSCVVDALFVSVTAVVSRPQQAM